MGEFKADDWVEMRYGALKSIGRICFAQPAANYLRVMVFVVDTSVADNLLVCRTPEVVNVPVERVQHCKSPELLEVILALG